MNCRLQHWETKQGGVPRPKRLRNHCSAARIDQSAISSCLFSCWLLWSSSPGATGSVQPYTSSTVSGRPYHLLHTVANKQHELDKRDVWVLSDLYCRPYFLVSLKGWWCASYIRGTQRQLDRTACNLASGGGTESCLELSICAAFLFYILVLQVKPGVLFIRCR